MKHVQKAFLKEKLCTLQVFLCALISRPFIYKNYGYFNTRLIMAFKF